ncbi:hypothetical protein ACWCYY_35140 [Kitasatospora sp. NPDC001664]
MDDHDALEGAGYLEELAALALDWAGREPGPASEHIVQLAEVIQKFTARVREDRGRQDLLDAVAELQDAAQAADPQVRARRLRAAAQFVTTAEQAGADRIDSHLAAIIQPNGDVLFVRHSMLMYDTASVSLVTAKICGDMKLGDSFSLAQTPIARNGLCIMTRANSPEEANLYAEHMLDTIADPDLRPKKRGLRGPVAFLYYRRPEPDTEPDFAPIPSRLFNRLGDAHHAAALAFHPADAEQPPGRPTEFAAG